MVHPLVYHADGALERSQMRDAVFGEHGQAEAGEQFGDGVVYFGIDVVGTARKHDAMGVGLLHPAQGLLALRAHVVMEADVFFPRSLHRSVDFLLGGCGGMLAHDLGMLLDQLHEQALLQLLLLVVGQVRVQEGDVLFLQFVDIQAQGLRIAHDDGAVVVVAGAFVFLALPLCAGHPDEIGALGDQVHHVAMADLRGIAGVFGRDGLDALFVGLLRGGIRNEHAEAQLGEEGEPEGIVLVHVERTRDAHHAAGRLFGGKRLVVEKAMALVVEQIGNLALALRHAGAALAAVAGDEATVLARGLVDAEVVDGEQAVVLACLAAGGAMGGMQGIQLVGSEQSGSRIMAAAAHAGFVTVARQKRRTVGAHVARDIGAHGIHFGKLLEGTQHGIVQEGAALHDDLFTHVMRVADLDDLEQGILDDGDGKARGDVAHGGAFLLRLLNAAVHEHRAAAAQVNGIFCRIGGFGELADFQVQAGSEALDEGAAARRTSLVEHDAVDNAILHAQALHVLAADVQDEFHAREHFLGAAQMRDGLDFARVDAQSLQQQALAVTGHGRMAQLHLRGAVRIFGKLVIELGDAGLRGTQHIALIIGIEGPQQAAVFGDERGLEGGGTGIDAQKRLALVGFQGGALHAFRRVALLEFVIFGLVGEQRGKAHDLAALDVADTLQTVDDVVQPFDLGLFRTCDRTAGGNEQVGVFRDDDVIVVQVERLIEAIAQFRQVLQGAAQEGDMAADGPAACQTGNGLGHNRLEDGSGNVFPLCALVQKRLDVGFRENAATARDRI